MKRIYFAALVGLFGCVSALSAQGRSEFLLEKNWKFTREDNNEFIKPAFDDSKWQSVTVPHDWAIYGPFSSQNDKQEVAISQDGQKEAMEHAGRTAADCRLSVWDGIVPSSMSLSSRLASGQRSCSTER